jgi:hypothetical protein
MPGSAAHRPAPEPPARASAGAWSREWAQAHV